jgi:hypothetical protein
MNGFPPKLPGILLKRRIIAAKLVVKSRMVLKILSSDSAFLERKESSI